MTKQAKQYQPTHHELYLAYLRAKLYQHLSFGDAMANKGLSLALVRMAQTYQAPKPVAVIYQ